MTAEEAKKFGLIDSVVERENKSQYLDKFTTSTWITEHWSFILV